MPNVQTVGEVIGRKILDMKKPSIWILKVIAAGLIAVGILSVFVCIYHYEGVHVGNSGNGTDYKWEAGQLKSQMTEGFSWFCMDENGFNNSEAHTDRVDILLMGSSHMEACEVPQEKNLGSLLNAEIPDMTTYNIGIGGHTIYRCVDNMVDAIQTYHPEKFVILETDRVKLDRDSMQAVIAGDATAIPSYDSGIMYYLQKIPAVKLLYSQVSNWIDSESNGGSDASGSNQSISDPEEYRQCVTRFLQKAVDAVAGTQCKLVIFYQPPTKLMPEGTIDCAQNEEDYRTVFAEVCAELGIVFLDMTEDFQTLYREESVLTHGFSNTAVGEGHLNEAGHRVIADALKAILLGNA